MMLQNDAAATGWDMVVFDVGSSTKVDDFVNSITLSTNSTALTALGSSAYRMAEHDMTLQLTVSRSAWSGRIDLWVSDRADPDVDIGIVANDKGRTIYDRAWQSWAYTKASNGRQAESIQAFIPKGMYYYFGVWNEATSFQAFLTRIFHKHGAA